MVVASPRLIDTCLYVSATSLYYLRVPCFAQVDLDLGNYERFMNLTLTRDNNITTGKIYQVFQTGSY